MIGTWEQENNIHVNLKTEKFSLHFYLVVVLAFHNIFLIVVFYGFFPIRPINYHFSLIQSPILKYADSLSQTMSIASSPFLCFFFTFFPIHFFLIL